MMGERRVFRLSGSSIKLHHHIAQSSRMGEGEGAVRACVMSASTSSHVQLLVQHALSIDDSLPRPNNDAREKKSHSHFVLSPVVRSAATLHVDIHCARSFVQRTTRRQPYDESGEFLSQRSHSAHRSSIVLVFVCNKN